MAEHHHEHHDHGDGQGHHHQHHHEKTTEVNRDYWNNMATSYDTRFERTIEQLIREIQKRKDFIGAAWVDESEQEDDAKDPGEAAQHPKREVRLLDYACGTGLVSRALAQYTTQCVGVDIAEKMAASYNDRAENQGLSESEMHAYQGNLLDPSGPSASLSSPHFYNFDIAAVGLGFHHFVDPDLAASRLAERLRPGGVLVLVDFLSHDHDATTNSTVQHHGFSEEQMRGVFGAAGAGKGFAMEEIGKGIVFEGAGGEGKRMVRRVFIARGEKE